MYFICLIFTLSAQAQTIISGRVAVTGRVLIGNLAPPASPTASFTSSTNSGAGPLTVVFTDTSINTPTSWTWAFGDGGASTSQNPTHIFTNAGIYVVVLTAANASGSSAASNSIIVNITGQFYANFEAGNNGDFITAALLTTGTQSQLAGAWRITSNSVILAAGLSKVATAGQLTLPYRLFYNSAAQSDTGTRGIGLDLSVGELHEFIFSTAGYPLLSGGCWYVNNLTNTPNNGAQWDLIRFNDGFGQNTTVVQFFNGSGGQTSFFRAHSASNSVTQFGAQLLSNPPSTNWITWLWDGANSRWTIAIYDSTGTNQVSTNSFVGIGLNSVAKSFDILAYGHTIYEARTNYYDNFVLNTNGVFPLYPP